MRGAALALVLALLAAPARLRADDLQPVERAKAHFKQGRAYQDVGQYENAAAEYKAAYVIDPRPEMLFNIAQAYRLANLRAEAVDYFQRYLAAQPDGAGADEARMHVATLTKQLDAARPREPAPAAPASTIIVTRTPGLVEVRGPRSLRIAGLVAAGTGLAGVGLGIKLGLDARGAADELSSKDSGAWTPEDRATFEDGRRADRNMKIAYAVGGALVITGAVLFYFGARTRLEPVVTPNAAGVALRGSL